MSAPIPPSSGGCCAPPCPSPLVVNVPGPAGPPGQGSKGDKGDKGDTGSTGPAGPAGPAGPGNTLNSVSPTTTRGDLIVDNGSNHPLASDVRLAAGTDGQVLTALASQPTGLAWETISPQTVTNANDIPRFSGTSGNPMAIKDSKLLITDDGAIQSTPTGGNARGNQAVDLQVSRGLATQVASGLGSGVLCGASNTASATFSLVAGGQANSATDVNAAVCGGQNNTAGAQGAFVAGGVQNSATAADSAVLAGAQNTASNGNAVVGAGRGNTASGNNSSVLGGTINQASGDSASIIGGSNNTASAFGSSILGGYQASSYLQGQVVHAAGKFANQGDAQASELIFRNNTTDATPTELFLDGAGVRAVIPSNTVWGFSGQVVGATSAGVCGVSRVSGGIKNIGGVVTLVGGSANVNPDVTDGPWPGSVAITADGANLSLKITVTGAGATSIRWLANLRLTEVGFV